MSHEDLPTLPTLANDPIGVQAQEIIRAWVFDTPGEKDYERKTQAIIKWLTKGGTQLLYRMFKTGVVVQTQADIDAFRARMAIFQDWLDDAQDEQTLLNEVTYPIVLGDFTNVRDLDDPSVSFKMPGVFDSARDKQTEVSTLYRLSTAVDVEQQIWTDNLDKFFEDIGSGARDLVTGARDAAEGLETGLIVLGSGLGVFALYRLLK